MHSLPFAAAGLSVLLAMPAVGVGWVLDDYYHRTVLLERSRLRDLLGPPSEMFRFFRGDPDRTGRLMDIGLFPWWTDPNLKAEFLQALTVLTHRLDYALWPDSPDADACPQPVLARDRGACHGVLLPADTWHKLGGGCRGVAVRGGRRAGATVGFLANRNVLVAATFGVSALIAHDRARRDGSRLAGLLAPLLLMAALFAKEEGIGTCAYLAAYALFVDPRGRWRGVPGPLAVMP